MNHHIGDGGKKGNFGCFCYITPDILPSFFIPHPPYLIPSNEYYRVPDDTANSLHRLKLKRPQTAKAFRAQIDRMYEEVAADASSKPRL